MLEKIEQRGERGDPKKERGEQRGEEIEEICSKGQGVAEK